MKAAEKKVIRAAMLRVISVGEQRILDAVMAIYEHPKFSEQSGWVLTKDPKEGIAMSKRLWDACAALSRSAKRRGK